MKGGGFCKKMYSINSKVVNFIMIVINLLKDDRMPFLNIERSTLNTRVLILKYSLCGIFFITCSLFINSNVL